MTSETSPFLRDPAFRQLLQDIRQTSNWTNWFYVLRSWLILAVVLTASFLGLEWIFQSGVGWGWATGFGPSIGDGVAAGLVATGSGGSARTVGGFSGS